MLLRQSYITTLQSTEHEMLPWQMLNRVFECAAHRRDDMHFRFIYTKCHKIKHTNLLVLLNRRPDAGSITNHNYIVSIPPFIPFCWWRSWLSPIPINNKLVVVPSDSEDNYIYKTSLDWKRIKKKLPECGIQVNLLYGVLRG